MAIHRAPRPEQHYTQVRNDVLRDERLSYRARGLLAALLSRPDNWSTTSEALAREGQEGRDAIRTALSELEAAGYLTRERRQDDRGRWSTQAVLYDTPQPTAVQEVLSPAAATDDGFPGVGSPVVGFPGPTTKNTDQEQAGPPTSDPARTPAPPKTPKAKGPADLVAQAVYDAASGMVPYLGVRAIAARALKVDGTTVEAVTAAMVGLYGQGRPITLQTVGQALAGGASTPGVMPTNTDHWREGGAFA